ncbi:X-Pro dipeptidyl-peptidase [Diaporthe sp. PMI_573]|nr:X-Pro dipeptidyl-peptidase [Diaporthaceae sp. PMI_573]
MACRWTSNSVAPGRQTCPFSTCELHADGSSSSEGLSDCNTSTPVAANASGLTSQCPRVQENVERDWDVVSTSDGEQLTPPVSPGPCDAWQARLIAATAGHQERYARRTFETETMQDRIVRVAEDEQDIKTFWAITFSSKRYDSLLNFYEDELASLQLAPFDTYDQDAGVDYLLLQGYLNRRIRQLKLDKTRNEDASPLLPFASALVDLWELRQAAKIDELEPQWVAGVMHDATGQVNDTAALVTSDKLNVSKEAAYRALENISQLLMSLAEFDGFLSGYVPLYDWWVKSPYSVLVDALQSLVPVIQTKLAGMRPNDEDEIVGEPIGRDGLLVELEAEMIPYTPEELLTIADEKYAWCEKEMKKASAELGYGDDWRAALRHVQGIYVEPGKQPSLVRRLIVEATEYVKQNDLVTVPRMAENYWRMFMMTPEAQKTNPFFLGGPSIYVSYPTPGMSHEDKLMSMRGNGPHLSHATAFHEMIPGHHLQIFMAQRHRPYRGLFDTPFYVEGWAMYWELVFWDRGDFFVSPEDRIGTLFWRMHRCARILFSLRFHLGELTPQECIDLLVDMVGHERATAEGEVRRSLNGNYSPLYQVGYFLGAMQLHALRQEALDANTMGEKEFHDRVLKSNQMPIELLRALLLRKDLSRDYKSQWRFYDNDDGKVEESLPMRLMGTCRY